MGIHVRYTMAAMFGRLLFLFGYLAVSRSQAPINTEYGPLQGHVVQNVHNGEFSRDVISYLGVPYGKSTAGSLRFAKPEKLDPWAPETFIADTLGQSCPQGGGWLMEITNPGWDDYGEDCLNLNIFTPTTGGSHPVMVWFHGGAYTGGANIQYPGHFLATRDLIIVIVNYRLNHFGFAFTNTEACPGNFGLWDQKLALEFVRDNIAAFGGDPGRVTIFGQSAGASSSSLHMVSPHSQGLMHQAILESGTESSLWSLNWPESTPENYIWEVASKVNCTEGGEDHLMIECLRALPWQDVYDARFSCTPGHFCQGMAPVVDGPGGFLPERPEDLRKSGNFMKGPIITGLTKDDGSLYTLAIIPESFFGGFNRSEFLYFMEERLVGIWAAMMDEVTVEDVFKSMDYNYSPWPYIENEEANREAFNLMMTDAAFGMPWDKQLKNHYSHAPSYGYVYDYDAIPLFPDWMGVPHMGELIAVWGYAMLADNPAVKEDSGIYLDRLINFTSQDVQHTVYWQQMYSNFAHVGNPTPTPVTDPLGHPTTWRPFSVDDMAFLYVHDQVIGVQTEWEQHDYAFWREYAGWITREYPFPIRYAAKNSRNSGGLPDNWLEVVNNILSEYVLRKAPK